MKPLYFENFEKVIKKAIGYYELPKRVSVVVAVAPYGLMMGSCHGTS